MTIELFHWQPRVPRFGLPQRLPMVGLPTWMVAPSKRAGNFGDELGPIVVRAMMRSNGLRQPTAAHESTRLLSVGSVLHFARPGDHVWGTGINGKKRRPLRVGPGALTVHAVRGPRTHASLHQEGFDVPRIFGDPALLLPVVDPDYALRDVTTTREVTLIPNLNDAHIFRDHPAFVSPLNDPLVVARAIAESEMVVGSSLHAMVLADALGVSSRPITANAESTFKYADYYEGTNRSLPEFASTVDEALAMGPVESWDRKIDALQRAFPRQLFDAVDE